MWRFAICIVLALAAAPQPPAQATFTGRNGGIAIAFSGGCVRMVAPVGSALRVLGPCTDSAAPDAIDWSPDGRELLSGLAGAIWSVRSNGAQTRPVPLRGAPGASAPAFAPDGRRFAYTRAGAIRTARLDGSGDRRLRTGSHPAWSPDGRTIAYTAPQGNTTGLRLLDAATGRDLRELSTDAGPADWSPDGRALLYATADRTIMAVAPGGAGPPRVLARDGTAPVWSPDGLEIAYIRGSAAGRWAVWRKRIDGPARRIYLTAPSAARPPGVPVELAWQARPASS